MRVLVIKASIVTGKDLISDTDGKGSIQIDGVTLGYGVANGKGWAFDLRGGVYAGMAVYADASSATGKKLIITKGAGSANTIIVNNFNDKEALKGSAYLGITLDNTPEVALTDGVIASGASFWKQIGATIDSLAGQAASQSVRCQNAENATSNTVDLTVKDAGATENAAPSAVRWGARSPCMHAAENANYYIKSSCSRNILEGYRPIRTSKPAPELANGHAPDPFQASRNVKLLQSRAVDPFLTCLSACSPLEFCGSSCEMNSVYFQKSKLRHCHRRNAVEQTPSSLTSKTDKPGKVASNSRRCQPARYESAWCKKRSRSRNDLKAYSSKCHIKIVPNAAETGAIGLQPSECIGTDLIHGGSGTLTGKTGGAYDVNSLAYAGGGYEYRKYTMGMMALLWINLKGDGRNTGRGYYRTRSCSRNILKCCKPELLKNCNGKCKAPSIKNIAGGKTVIG
jgi:hypothetical protein